MVNFEKVIKSVIVAIIIPSVFSLILSLFVMSKSFGEIFLFLLCGPLSFLYLISSVYKTEVVWLILLVIRMFLQIPLINKANYFWAWNITLIIFWTIGGLAIGLFIFQS